MRKIFVIVLSVFLYGCISNSLASMTLKNGTGVPVDFNFDCDGCEGSCASDSCKGVTFGAHIQASSSDTTKIIQALVTNTDDGGYAGWLYVDSTSGKDGCTFNLDNGVYDSSDWDGTCYTYADDDEKYPKWLFSQIHLCGSAK